MWDTSTGAPARVFLRDRRAGAVLSMSFDRSGTRLVTGGVDGIDVWDVSEGLVQSFDTDDVVVSVGFDAENARILAAPYAGTIYVVESGELVRARSPLQSVSHMALHPRDPNVVATASRNGDVIRQHLAVVEPTHFAAEAYAFAGLVYASEGDVLAAGLEDGSVRLLWGAEQLESVEHLPVAAGELRGLAADGPMLAGLYAQGRIILWSLEEPVSPSLGESVRRACILLGREPTAAEYETYLVDRSAQRWAICDRSEGGGA